MTEPTLTEPAARRVLLLQAFDGAADNPLWTAQDRAWATRLARDTGAAAATAAGALDQRATHALQRLLPRSAAVNQALQHRWWRSAWPWGTLVLAFLLGLLVDSVGSEQRINLLSPPVWAVIAWNLLVMVWLLLSLLKGSRRPLRAAQATSGPGLRAWVVRQAQQSLAVAPPRATAEQPLVGFSQRWAQVTMPLWRQRVALLLHAAAAALALGLVAGLYLRGLVLDYRAGWQSTFLDSETVRATLALLLAPASAATGIAVPDLAAVQALRVMPGQPLAGMTSAAPWIHLYAAMLALCVLLPRGALALWALWRAWTLSRKLPIALHEPYFQRLLRDLQGTATVVQVLPCGTAPSPQATLALRDWFVAACGLGTVLHVAPAAAYGQEERVAPPPAGTTLFAMLVDLASTPEEDSHGRSLRAALRPTALANTSPGVACLVLADEAAWLRRFATLPARLAERRAAWAAFAHAHGAGFVGVNLEQPDLAAAEAALQRAQAVLPGAQGVPASAEEVRAGAEESRAGARGGAAA